MKSGLNSGKNDGFKLIKPCFACQDNRLHHGLPGKGSCEESHQLDKDQINQLLASNGLFCWILLDFARFRLAAF